MRQSTYLFTLFLLAVLLLVGYSAPVQVAAAQPVEQVPTPDALCASLVSEAEARVNAQCDSMSRNQACYGNQLVDVTFQPGSNLVFNQSGDTVDLLQVQQISTAPLDLANQNWGIAVLKAQANLPKSLPGQNVTFILFGDTTVDNPTPDMHAVVVSTRIGGFDCANAPDSAVLIQSPRGQEVAMNLNGADVTLGSTAYVTAQENRFLTLGIIEGQGTVSAFGTTRIVEPGMQVLVPLGTNDNLHVIGPPSEPEPYNQRVIDRAPLILLDQSPQVVEVTPTPTLVPNCVPRTDWLFRYTVYPGDTLSGIAQRAGVSTTTLASGNCIADVNRIFAGQVLRVPRDVPPPPPPTTSTPTTVPTPTVSLSASPPSILPPQCATLMWSTTNALTVLLDGQPVAASGSQLVCPTVDTTYTLTATGANNTSAGTSATVYIQTVSPTPLPVCGNYICEPGEDAQTCPSDCYIINSTTCGDGVCEFYAGESSNTCSADCVATCGNYVCDTGETYATCPSDCG